MWPQGWGPALGQPWTRTLAGLGLVEPQAEGAMGRAGGHRCHRGCGAPGGAGTQGRCLCLGLW